jgi:hypothetical protein
VSELLSAAAETERERRRQVAELEAGEGADWSKSYRPGSFGCHELLDRTSFVGDMVEQYVLAHPACLANPEWYDLAAKAVAALRELYQQVGSEHG